MRTCVRQQPPSEACRAPLSDDAQWLPQVLGDGDPTEYSGPEERFGELSVQFGNLLVAVVGLVHGTE